MVTGSEVEIKGSSDAGETFYHVLVNASGELIMADGAAVIVSGEVVVTDGATVLNQNYGWNGTNWHKILIDVNTQTQVTTDFAHHQIHAENFFHTGLNTADLDSNALRINFTTPSGTTYAHLLVSAYVSGQAVLVLREAYDGGGSGGSTLTPFNRNRNSSNASILLSTHGTPAAGILTQGAAAGTGGTELINESLGSGKNKQTGESRNDNEWVLKASTSYQLELTSSTNDITATLAADWYEHTNEAT